MADPSELMSSIADDGAPVHGASQNRFLFLGVALILVSAAAFGAMAIFAKLAYREGADVHGVLLIRFAVASALLWALMAVTGTPRPRGRDMALLVGMGSVGYVGQSLTYFTALERLPAGTVAVVFYTYPVLVMVATVALARRLPRVGAMIASVAATVGVCLVAGPSLTGDALGLLLAATAAVTYTGYIIFGSRLSSEVSPLASTATVCLSAAVVYSAGIAIHSPALPASSSGWAAAVATAVVSTVVAILAFFAGLRRLGAAPAAAVSSAEPVVTAALAYLVFDEVFSTWQVAGAGLVCISVAAVSTTASLSAGSDTGSTDPIRSRATSPSGGRAPSDRSAPEGQQLRVRQP